MVSILAPSAASVRATTETILFTLSEQFVGADFFHRQPVHRLASLLCEAQQRSSFRRAFAALLRV